MLRDVDIEHFEGVGGVPIHVIHSLGASKPKAEVVIVHGYSDHGERKGNMFEVLGRAGYRLHCPDHRGHGRSGGVRGYFRRFEDVVIDIETFVGRLRDRVADGRPIFLCGDSMGAIVTGWVLARHRVEVDAAAVSGLPLLPTRSVSPTSKRFAVVAAALAPRVLVPTFDAHLICSDDAVIDDYLHDPMVFYPAKIRLRAGVEIMRATDDLVGRLADIDQPLLLQHGADDHVAQPASSRTAYRRVGTDDKELRLYDGLRHGVWLEPSYPEVLGDVATWLDAHLDGSGPGARIADAADDGP